MCVCVCVLIVRDLETSTIRQSSPELDSSSTEKRLFLQRVTCTQVWD